MNIQIDDNPIRSIEALNEACRLKILENARHRAMQLKWVQQRSLTAAREIYLSSTDVEALHQALRKAIAEIRQVYIDLFDGWMFLSLIINVHAELPSLFDRAWHEIGPKPKWLKNSDRP